ncbi:multicopper oxidase [Xylariaceae sp. AK1471]|nr:multicopper oxidase [Xylariaceae sp. AK1471]
MRSGALLAAIGSVSSTSLISASSIPWLSHQTRADACNFDSSTSPQCWGDYSLDTNYYDETPDTGVTREYWFELRNITAAIDGVERIVLAVNGTVPGPTIIADWGDNIVVHVSNGLQDNGTSIHFHGVRQLETNQMDGTNSIQQCPIAPGDTFTHSFKAQQYGHSWYHSHFSVQAWNGVFGGILINGPASAPYDEDLGVLMLNDWYHNTTDYLWATSARSGAPPAVQNGLINGTNVYGSGGKRFETTFTAGKRYRIRLINSAIDTHFKFMIDNHNMTVIASGFVPLVPYQTNVLSIAIGQRYDIIVEADQSVDSYWMRAFPATSCSGTNENADNIKGIIRYDEISTADPETSAYSYTTDCSDEPMSSLVPYLALNASVPATTTTLDLDFPTNVTDTGLRKWTINGNDFQAYWDAPTLQQGLIDPSYYTTTSGIARLSDKNSWVYFVIENNGANAPPISHPIHLHGHDFYVLAQEQDATYSSTGTTLQLTYPPRRDTAILPADGFLVIGFITDNPGVWPLHCHIGWHVAQGFAFQMVEREDEIAGISDLDSINATCANWNAYATANNIIQDDSGL